MEDLQRLKKTELQERLKEKGLPTTGLKGELVERLQAKGLTSSDCDKGAESMDNICFGSGETKEHKMAEKTVADQDNVTQFDSISQHCGSAHTSKSSTISSLSSRAKAAAKRAALEAKAMYLQKQQEMQYRIEKERIMRENELKERELALELEKQRERHMCEAQIRDEELKMKMQLERLHMQAEISAAAAEEESYTKYLESHTVQESNMAAEVGDNMGGDRQQSQGAPQNSTLNPHAAEWRSSTPWDNTGEQHGLMTIMQQQHQEMQNQSQQIKKCIDAVKELQAVKQPIHAGRKDNELCTPNNTSASAYQGQSPHIGGQVDMLLDAISLPRTTLMKFDGNPMNFWLFMNAFDSCVGNSSVGDGVKLNRLLEYCSEKAAKVIRPCALMHPTEGYIKARNLLAERFGNDYQISEAWITKVIEGPAIRPNCGTDIQDLADDLRSCTETLRAMNRLDEIDSRVRMVQLVQRLPPYLQARWRGEAVTVLRNTGRYPGIEKLVQFLSQVASEINDPVFGMSHDRQRNSRIKHVQEKTRNIGSSFNVQVKDVNIGKSASLSKDTPMVESKNQRCHLCDAEDHILTSCTKFKEMKPESRLMFVKEKGLCFNCLKMGKHTARWCRARNYCGIQGCNKHHSRLLHEALHKSASSDHDEVGSSSERAEARTCACGPSPTDVKKMALPIVSVRVRGAGKENTVLTHALLDPGSNKTFCTESLIQKLDLKGKQTSLMLSTLNDGRVSRAQLVSLEVSGTGQHGKKVVQLPQVHAIKDFPSLMSSKATQGDVAKWHHLRDIDVSGAGSEVELLIGQDNPQALMPLEVRRGSDQEPYAVRCCLGWLINGPVGETQSTDNRSSLCNFVHGALQPQDTLETQVEQFWKVDGAPSLAHSLPQMSQDDKRVIEVWNSSLVKENGHYQMSIPFRDDPPELPDNRQMAERRLQSLRRRFSKRPELLKKYTAGMEDLIGKGYAERVSPDMINAVPGKTWYLPHHCVLNQNKPDKLRIVFDCSAESAGVSLNKKVLQGPDFVNRLLGVLIRFREHPVAVMGDIEGMFHQVKVSPNDRDALRFLWWKDGNLDRPPEVYRMTVHLFGGIWSPSCATFALRKTAEDHANEFDPEAVRTVHENFYVDDCLKSLPTVQSAIWLIEQLCLLLKEGGFRLTKWVSNHKEVMETIPQTERAKEVQDLNLPLPVERALGVEWNTSTDVIGVKVKPKDGPCTRRGLLAVMSSVFDPLGLVSPFVLLAKKIFQAECRSGKGWDEELEQQNKEKWSRWLKELPLLQGFNIERCITPSGQVKDAQLHHFCDASEEAYGAVSYLRLLNADGDVHCSLLLAKSRLAPVKPMTIPRLELSASVMAVQMDNTLRNELRISLQESVFWTDSEIVLQYIKNTRKRFHTFVANRVAVIHDGSKPHQWRHVSTKLNPADDASRGLRAAQMVSSDRWRQGPQFLYYDESEWPQTPEISAELPHDDKEVKQEGKACAVDAKQSEALDRLCEKFSCWFRLRKAIAWMLRFKVWLRRHKTGLRPRDGRIQVDEMAEAEKSIVAYIQRKTFHQELQFLQEGKRVPRSSIIHKLEPQKDDQNLIRVGGRLDNAPIPDETRHPVVLPRDHHISELVVRYVHEWGTGHSGRDHVLSVVRQKYWIPRARPLITRILKKCTLCKRLKGSLGQQKMCALIPERVTPNNPPFTHVGVDCFGPFFVKRGRAQEKRYGCLFTCLAVRAIHLEKLSSLDADSFINALMRFAARRGMPETITSDNGTNFVGGERELREAIKKWNECNEIKKHLLLKNIEWRFNPPSASHMGGIWERQIRTVRKVLNAIMREQVLDDERLDTFFCEVESIINSRPLTPLSEDPKDQEPLTPNHLLLLRRGPTAPPGVFKGLDKYRRRWRHVQLLADHFWRRWLREYLPLLHLRQKWLETRRNFAEGDIVLIMDESSPRKCWPLGRIVKVFPGRDGLVRSAQVKTRWNILTRPINKLCLLEAVSS